MLRQLLPNLRGLKPRFRSELGQTFTESMLFVLSIGILVATIWGRLRTTGPVVLAVVCTIGFASGFLPRRPFFRLLAVLVITFIAAYSLRNHTGGLMAHRVGRYVLCSGLVLSILLSFPSVLIRVLKQWSGELERNPNGIKAASLAVVFITLPTFFLYRNTTIHVWTGDTMPLVPTVVELHQTGSRELSRFVPPSGFWRWDSVGPNRPYFVREVPGRAGVYSTYPAGMELFAWPVVVVANVCGYSLLDDDVHLRIEKATASGVSAIAMTFFFLLALHVGSPVGAAAVTLLMATGSVFSSTLGMLLWQQGGVVFWMLAALLVEFRTQGKTSWKGLFLQSLACSGMLACRPSAVTFLIPFGLWVLARDWRRGVLLPLASLVCYSPWAAIYWAIYRNPFGPSMGFLGETWTFGQYIPDVLFSPGRGLFVFQPFLLFAILLLLPKARYAVQAWPPGWCLFAVSMMSLHLLLISSWPCWWGGFCYGSRLIAEVVPIAAIFCVRPIGWLLSQKEGWISFAIVALLGFAIHVPCLYYDAWLWNALPFSADAHPWKLWDWSHPPFLYGLVTP
jgi:hypothetical protein